MWHKKHGMEEMNYSKLIKETIKYNDSHFRELFGLYFYCSFNSHYTPHTCIQWTPSCQEIHQESLKHQLP